MRIHANPDPKHWLICKQCCGSMTFWIRIRGSVPLTNGSGSGGLGIYVSDQDDKPKKIFFAYLRFCSLLFEATFTS